LDTFSQAAAPQPKTTPFEEGQSKTIEQVIEAYLQDHRKANHRPKTLECYQNALSQFQQYLLIERQLLQVAHLTKRDIQGWPEFLRQIPGATGKQRSAITVETYVRAVRAFCNWLIRRGEVALSPLSKTPFLRVRTALPRLIQPDEFEQFVLASQNQEAKEPEKKRNTARDRALLWLLYDTGISVSELCALRLEDLNQQTGQVRVRGNGDHERLLALGPKSLGYLLSYLDQLLSEGKNSLTAGRAQEDFLFFTERGLPFTKNCVEMLLCRLRKRAKRSDIAISPQILRHSFALRYLQAGGEPDSLRAFMGYKGMGQVKQYLRWHDELLHQRSQYSTEIV
jgi:site-specific recombinase XerD